MAEVEVVPEFVRDRGLAQLRHAHFATDICDASGAFGLGQETLPVSRAPLDRPDASDLVQHGERTVRGDRDALVFRDHEGAHRKQIVRLPEDLVVRMDFADERHGGGIAVIGPDERDQGEAERGHGPHVDRRPSRLGNTLRHPESRIERPGGIDVDDHFQAGLNHRAVDLRIGGQVEFALFHLGRDRG